MSRKKFLIIVDPQNDFIEGGSLAVEGGRRALLNLESHLIKHADEYDHIYVSLDTHNPTNLGFKENWQGDDVNKLIPCQPFPKELLKDARVWPKILYTAEEDVKTVESQPNFMVWPQHCIKGTKGHRIMKELEDVLMDLGDKVTFVTKGEDDARDCYSIFNYGDGSLTKLASPFTWWGRYDNPEIFIAGLAQDYCVLETIKGLQSLPVEGEFTLLVSMTAAIQEAEVVSELYSKLPKKINLKL